MRSMLEYQASLQAGLGREVECLKDQVDVLREQGERYTRYEQELADIKMRLQDFQIESDDIAELVRKNQNETLMSLESETCLDSREISIDRLDIGDSEQATLCVSHVSQSNNLLEETLVMPVQVDKEYNSVEDELECKDVRTGYSVLKEELRHAQTSYEADPELADNTSSLKKISGQENDHTDIEDRKNTDNNETSCQGPGLCSAFWQIQQTCGLGE